MKRTFFLMLYYGLARHLPGSYSRFGGPIWKKIRYYCGRNIFKDFADNLNIEKGIWFGKGNNIEVGDNSGIGINSLIK